MIEAAPQLLLPMPTMKLVVSNSPHSKRRYSGPSSHPRLDALLHKYSQIVRTEPEIAPILDAQADRLLGTLAKDTSVARKIDPKPEPQRILTWRRGTPQVGTANPRPPTLPAGLITTSEEYHAACAAIGTLAAQPEEPDIEGIVKFSCDYGEAMAAEIRRRGWRKR